MVGTTNVCETGKDDLGDDSAKFAASSCDAVARGTITSGEELSWDQESGGIGAKVLEEVGKTVQEHEDPLGHSRRDELIVREACRDIYGL
jgi:hypothetical protein